MTYETDADKASEVVSRSPAGYHYRGAQSARYQEIDGPVSKTVLATSSAMLGLRLNCPQTSRVVHDRRSS